MKNVLILFLAGTVLCSAQKTLSIISVTPTGQIQSLNQSQMITVTFSEAMVEVQAVPKDEMQGPMHITPHVSGKYRWQGTSTLSFIPDRPLTYATVYSVAIPSGIRSVNGNTLRESFEWKFVTPPPAIVGTVPMPQQRFVELDHAITLIFNQRVSPLDVSKFISIEEKLSGGKSNFPRFETIARDDTTGTKVVVRPVKTFSPGSTVTVRVNPGVKGIEGNLSMDKPFSLVFFTYRQFSFLGLKESEQINPESSLEFRFSNPVYEEVLLRHLRFVPEIVMPAREYYRNSPAEELYVHVELKPGTKYTGYILPGMNDRFGQVIKDTVSFSFSTRSFSPVLYMATGLGIIEAYGTHKYPLAVLNVDRFRVSMAKLRQEKIIPFLNDYDFEYGSSYGWEKQQNLFFDRLEFDPAHYVFDETVTPNLVPNISKLIPVNLDTVLGASRLGIVMLQSSYGEQRNKAVLQVTNLGITAKFSPHQNLVWVTNLKDASPVANASVELRNDSNRVLWKGKTDKTGIVRTPGYGALGLIQKNGDSDESGDEDGFDNRSRPRVWVMVMNGDDLAFTNSELSNGIEPWSFGIQYNWYPQVQKAEGSIFTDRGLYKAGERVEMKAVVRVLREGLWRIPKGDSVQIVVRNARNEEISQQRFSLSLFGSCSASLVLGNSAPLGYYSMTMSMKKGTRWDNLGYGSFRVEAFRPAEFEVTAMMDAKSYIVGDSIAGLLSAKYLFGAPLKNSEVRWRFSVTGTSFDPPGYEGFSFQPLYWLSKYSHSEYKEIAAASGRLDGQGVIRIRSKIGVGEVQRTVRLMLEGDVTSTTRQVLSGRASVTMHGAEYYVGIGQSSAFVSADSVLRQKIIAVTPEGKPVPERKIALTIFKRVWRSVRRAEVGGRYYWSSEVENIPVDSAVIVSQVKPVERTFTPRDPGFYYTQISSTDRRGNNTVANSYFYVSGSGYVPWERSNDDRIDLITEKNHYVPGDVARIIVKNPYEKAEALVSVEREGILQHFTTTVVGSAPEIRIPIKNDYLPNVFVSVVLLHGRTDSIAITKESDIGRPSFKIGYTNLSVSPLEKKLSVNIKTDKPDYRPGDTVAVSISTVLQTGKGIASEVTLSAADLGVLNLINYQLPNLFEQYYRERGLSVTTTESRAHLVEQRNYDEKGEVIGGGGAEKMMATMDAEGIRKDFRASAYWNPSIITDADGKATVRFKLPDNLTSFQLMAAAQSKESDFGYGEHAITVSKPLLLQPSLPRFVRVGDSFEGGVAVMNYSEKEKTVTIFSRVEGLRSEGPDSLMVKLRPGESKEVRWKLTAESVGTAKFIFRAFADGDYDGMQWTIPVQIPRLRETAATSSTLTEPFVQEKVIKPADINEHLGSLDVTVASTALVGLEAGVQYLFEYPYGCLEQKMSRVLPMILAADMVKSFSLPFLNGKDHRKIVQDVLDEIPQFQGSGGGFRYWKGEYSTEEYPYLSAYTMYGLVMAKRNGYRINQRSFQRGIEYVRSELNRTDSRLSESVHNNTRSLILYVLAENGSADYGYMEQLFANRSALSLEGRAFLLKALVAGKGNNSMISTLVNEFRSMMKIAPTTAHFEETQQPDWWCMWYSPVKTTAVIVQALIDAEPNDPFLPKLVQWIMDRQKSGRWRTTQENMFVAAALSSYFRIYEKDVPHFTAEVKIAGKKALTEIFEGRTTKQAVSVTPLNSLPPSRSPIDIHKTGEGRLYYTLRLHYYPKNASVMKDEGFTVQKSIEYLSYRGDSIAAIPLGTIARVSLTISTNQMRSFVVVDDPVPAGFEIINTSFQTTAQNLDENPGREWYFNYRERRDDRALFFADNVPAGVHHVSYLVRVTSTGTFAMPSTRVEQMYEPEVFGQTSSRVITVE